MAYNIELMVWGDGEPHLMFWDNIRGEDVNFVIKQDGAYISEYLEKNEAPILRKVDLIDELRQISVKTNAVAQAEINEILTRNGIVPNNA